MARPLRGRRSRFDDGEDASGGGAGDERQILSNSKARADTIVMAVRELARMEAELKALNADRREFLATHIKGDLGMKIADWNAVYRVSQLEVEDRDTLLDTLREGFRALGIGGSLDWVAAAEDEPQPAAEPPRRRGRRAATPVNPPVEHPDAFQMGKADGLAGHRDHAARYPNGEIGAAAYELGHDAGAAERHAGETGTESATPAETADQAVHRLHGGDPAAPPKRGRGRPKKNPQPELAIVEGTGSDAAA